MPERLHRKRCSKPYSSIDKADFIKLKKVTKRFSPHSRTTLMPNICLGFSDISKVETLKRSTT